MWVRNAWYVAGWSSEVSAEAILARTIINEPLALYRKADGAVVALEDRCCHRLAPLSKGRLEVGARSSDVDDALAGEMFRFTERAFLEDKEIIEAQQTVIELDPSRPMMSTSSDAGPNLFRGIVKRLIAAETAQPERVLAEATAD